MEYKYVAFKAKFGNNKNLKEGLAGKEFYCDFDIALKPDEPFARIVIDGADVEGLEEFEDIMNRKKVLIREVLGDYSRDSKEVYEYIELDEDLKPLLDKWLARDQFVEVEGNKVYRHVLDGEVIGNFVAATAYAAYYESWSDCDLLVRINNGEIICNNGMIDAAFEQDIYENNFVVEKSVFDKPDYIESLKKKSSL